MKRFIVINALISVLGFATSHTHYNNEGLSLHNSVGSTVESSHHHHDEMAP